MANIYLIGYRATGKTSTGKALAEKAGIPFIDADEELVRIEGRTVAEMVADKGWDYFRDRESDVLNLIAGKSKILPVGWALPTNSNCGPSPSFVVATGGGVILRPENIKVMYETGIVIWLKAGIETIASRMSGDGMTAHQRPSLSGRGVIDEIRDVLEQRLPLYDKAAMMAIDTDGKNPEQVCDEIFGLLSMR